VEGSPTPGGNDAVDLVDWCTNAADGLDYMNRTEACLKDLGRGELYFFDSDSQKPAIGRGTFLFEQRMETSRNKSESGSDLPSSTSSSSSSPPTTTPPSKVSR
jgi:hypothetical protein